MLSLSWLGEEGISIAKDSIQPQVPLRLPCCEWRVSYRPFKKGRVDFSNSSFGFYGVIPYTSAPFYRHDLVVPGCLSIHLSSWDVDSFFLYHPEIAVPEFIDSQDPIGRRGKGPS